MQLVKVDGMGHVAKRAEVRDAGRVLRNGGLVIFLFCDGWLLKY